MTTTQNGYYKIIKGKRGFYSVLKSANNKVLSQTEWMHNAGDVENNIRAQIKANNGTHALVIDMSSKEEHVFFLDSMGARKALDYNFNNPPHEEPTKSNPYPSDYFNEPKNPE